MIPLRAMSPLVRYEVRDRVAVVTVDNPPVKQPSSLLERMPVEGRAFHGSAP